MENKAKILKLRVIDFAKSITVRINVSIWCLLILLIVFNNFFSQLFTKIFVNPFLQYCSSNYIVDVVVIITNLLIAAFYIRKIKKNVQISPVYLFLLFNVTIYYWCFRFYDQNIWTFKEFWFFPAIKYCDSLFLFLLLNVSLFIKNLTSNLNPNSLEGDKFIVDESIGNNGEDLLNRKDFAKEIANRIQATNRQKSFAIGISGKWGSGKTSFLDLIERHLDKKDQIIIHFNPWKSSNTKSIISDFFDVLKTEISEYSTLLSRQLSNYSEKLVNIDDGPVSKTINQFVGILTNHPTLEEQYEEINKALKIINRQIVVFIDDLDRLDKDEVIEVIRLVRNTAKFYNTFFVVAYDRAYIINAVSEVNTYNSEFYLEKIFQLELPLPQFENTVIRNYLLEKLKENLEIDYFGKISELLSNNGYHKYALIDDFILTIRDATRFLNSFLLSFHFLKGEVNIIDLFNLELIKYKFPSVYQFVYNFEPEILTTSQSQVNGTFNYSLSNKKDERGNIISKEFVIDGYLRSDVEFKWISDSDKKKILNCLTEMFPSDNYLSGDKVLSIRMPSNFYKYFQYRLLEGSLSEIQFSKYRQLSQGEFNDKIYEWVQEGLRIPLISRLKAIKEYDNKDDYEKIVSAIFYIGRIPKIETKKEFYTGYDTNDLYDKLYEGEEKRKSTKYYSGDTSSYKKFVKSLFLSATSPYIFESYFIRRLFYDNYEISIVLSIDELNELRLIYLEKYLSSIEKIDSNVWSLYHNCTIIERVSAGANSFRKEEKPNAKANELFVEFIKYKDLEGFLESIKQNSGHEKDYWAISSIVVAIFGSFKEFGNFLEQFDEDKYTKLNEFRVFYHELEATNFSKSVNFKFQN